MKIKEKKGTNIQRQILKVHISQWQSVNSLAGFEAVVGVARAVPMSCFPLLHQMCRSEGW